jgi:hypothetical protein
VYELFLQSNYEAKFVNKRGSDYTSQIHDRLGNSQTYRRFNATGTELAVQLLPPADGDDSNPISHFQAIVIEMFEYALRNS